MIEEVITQDIVYTLAASPQFGQDGLCFAARATGLFRSDDGGHTWQDAYATLKLEEPLSTAAVAVSPNFESDQTVFAGVPGGVLRSVDSGQNWSVSYLPSPPPFVSTLAVSPNFAMDGAVFAGTLEDGVFYSGDRGAQWAAWNFGLLDLHILSLVISPNFANDETLFVGTDSGIYFSANGGRAWRELNFSMEWAPVISLALSPNFAATGTLFAGTESAGLFRSDDRGRSWLRLGQAAMSGAVNSILLVPHAPAQADIVVAGDGLLVSRDNGHSWANWPFYLPSVESFVSVSAPLGLDPGAPLLVGLADGRVLRLG